MCTLTWRNEDDLEVFFNRDELKTRSRAKPPREFKTEGGTRYLSPIDPDAGGTWMLANEHGLIICLLNRWHEETGTTFVKSRGQIVTELADCSSLPEALNLLPTLCAGAKPFDLVAFHQENLAGLSWLGDKTGAFEPQMPITSSSYQFEKVKSARTKAFTQYSSLEQFQDSQGQDSSAYTVRMNRPDAQTWSRSRLKVTSTEIHWDYWEEYSNLEKEPTLHQISLALS